MLKTRLFILFILISLVNSYAQDKRISFDLSSSAAYITNSHVPFWLRSNQFGSVPLYRASLSFFGGIHKEYKRDKSKLFDWGASAEARLNTGYKANFILIEGYAKVRLNIFEIRAGRSKEIMGLCDSSLSSGAFDVSGNALGIPKVQVSIPEFYSLPLLGKVFAFKANFAHGWVGKAPMNSDVNILQIETYLHQTSLYGRIGKPEWRFKLYGGFNHQALWGNEKQSYGPDYAFSPFKTYLYVLRGGTYLDGYTRLGDHLGSIDLGFEYDLKNVRILAYRQNLYEAGALYYLANIRDGLNGLSIVNLLYNYEGFQWKKMLLEVFYTKSQGGETWSVPRPSGAEDYYNHYQYVHGWSYKGVGIGNPFITQGSSTREGLSGYEYFNNNRVIAFHFGYEGSLNDWEFKLKTSYSLNYGTYSNIGLFGEKKQFSAYLNVGRELKNGLRVGVTGAFDVGELYYNSVGVLVGVGKRF